MDFIPHLRRECLAFETAARQVAGDAPMISSCPDWSMANLVAHLGWVHRFVTHIVVNRLRVRPDVADRSYLGLPAGAEGWPGRADERPYRGRIPAGMLDWFAEGAAALADAFASTDLATEVVTWSTEQTVGFWLRAQTIEATVHRWDAQHALGAAEAVDTELALDAIDHDLTVVVGKRRSLGSASAGAGERYGFRQTDGDRAWVVEFDGEDVRLHQHRGPEDLAADVELAGTASQLMLFCWRRITAEQLTVRGDRSLLARYASLLPDV
ncbi:MAG TPA: maleylpyruvate isomerase family mycothiol-dependent enzyme [Pseudonocardiaceae bacterium]|jgi:uncharacterized protein (TIGR03083 family)|nr:maleylpyruvate isomerase family mycothiol-dependent enzyme [Pseudonocardiaceae bacterium]